MGFGSIIGSVISAGASLLGGKQQAKSQEAASDANALLQKEFAQQGVQWKTADAKAAGIHPLYAMGAQPMQFTPSYVGGSDYITPALSEMGQGIGRAIDATRSAPSRLQARVDALTVERGELENALLRSQIRLTDSQIGPPLPTGPGYMIPGQTQSGIAVDPSRSISAASSNFGVERAVTPANKIYVGYDGTPILSPSPEYAESMEGNWPVGAGQHLVHNVLPFYTDRFISALQAPFSRRHPRTSEHDGYTRIHW